jgi:hypothetical protein
MSSGRSAAPCSNLFSRWRSIRLLGISLSSLGAEEVKPETQFDLSV